MSNELARAILALKADGTRLLYGEATADNTVSLEGAATAVELPALAPVAAGDYCAVLAQGADRLILGPVNRYPVAGTYSGTTNATTSSLVVTHGLPWTPSAVLVQPSTPDGGSNPDRYVSSNVRNLTSTTFTIGRCIAADGSLLTSTAVTGYWLAMP